MCFSNKVVIITNVGSSGIGLGAALLFTKNNANVVIVGRNGGELYTATTKCEEVGKKPLVIKADVSNDYEAASIIKQTIDKFGRLDILLNNVGFIRGGSLGHGTCLNAFDQVVKNNLCAVINLTELAVPHLDITGGNIINIFFVDNMEMFKNFKGVFNVVFAYGLCKIALNYVTQAAALELDGKIRVNAISSGPLMNLVSACNLPEDLKKRFTNMTNYKTIDETEALKDIDTIILDLAKNFDTTGCNVLFDDTVINF